jgi:hypothetical protein
MAVSMAAFSWRHLHGGKYDSVCMAAFAWRQLHGGKHGSIYMAGSMQDHNIIKNEFM